eukprot:jgi/Psemu1/53987/gm1.53987_g
MVASTTGADGNNGDTQERTSNKREQIAQHGNGIRNSNNDQIANNNNAVGNNVGTNVGTNVGNSNEWQRANPHPVANASPPVDGNSSGSPLDGAMFHGGASSGDAHTPIDDDTTSYPSPRSSGASSGNAHTPVDDNTTSYLSPRSSGASSGNAHTPVNDDTTSYPSPSSSGASSGDAHMPIDDDTTSYPSPHSSGASSGDDHTPVDDTSYPSPGSGGAASSKCQTRMAPGAMGFKTTTKQMPAKAIKQKSKRKHRKTYPNTIFQHVEQIALKTVNKNGFKGKFMETNWGWTTVGEKKYSLAQAVSSDSFKTLDSTVKKFVLAFAKSEPSLRIFAKASTQFAKQHLGTPENIEITRTFAEQIVESKPKIGRGTKCDSVNSGYAIIGMRPNQLKSGNGVYVFKNNVDSTTKDNLEQKALHIVKEMQLCLSPMSKFVNLETTVMNEVVSRTTLNAIGHHAAAFSIGKDYHSKCHINADMFYTRLTVIAPRHLWSECPVALWRYSITEDHSIQ